MSHDRNARLEVPHLEAIPPAAQDDSGRSDLIQCHSSLSPFIRTEEELQRLLDIADQGIIEATWK